MGAVPARVIGDCAASGEVLDIIAVAITAVVIAEHIAEHITEPNAHLRAAVDTHMLTDL